MDLFNFSNILSSIGAVTALGGAILSVFKILKEVRKSRKTASDKILHEAKEHNDLIKADLEGKLNLLKSKLENLEASVTKDLIHIKETQASEIKNLGSKIEELRQEIHSGHASLISLLTRLIDKN